MIKGEMYSFAQEQEISSEPSHYISLTFLFTNSNQKQSYTKDSVYFGKLLARCLILGGFSLMQLCLSVIDDTEW